MSRSVFTIQAVNTLREMGKEALQSAREVEKLAQVANAGIEEFQRAAFAAKSVGFESEKLADIYKDVNDKVGDFIATGGGAMADFFENIAPKVDVTAEQFEKLSGPEALQLYVSSLERAGVSQQQMTFYMEALASDATALLPLLRDNGKAMGDFAKQADELGIVMSSEEIAKAKEVAHNLGLLNAKVEALQNKKLLENADAILEFERSLAELKIGLIEASGTLQGWVDDFDAHNARNAANARKFWKDVAQSWDNLVARSHQMAADVKAAIADMVGSIGQWMRDKLNAIWDGAAAKIEWIANKFKWLDNVVVRNSYIPDMVDSIGEHMRRLEAEMVDPARRSLDKTADIMRSKAREMRDLLADLFPEAEAERVYRARLEMVADSDLSADEKAEAERILWERRYGTFRGLHAPELGYHEDDPLPAADEMTGQAKKMADEVEKQTVRIAKSFADMAQETLRSIDNLGSAIKGGDFFGILKGAVGLFLQIGSTGAFGSSVQRFVSSDSGRLISGAASRVPGFSTGGSFKVRGFSGVDRNILSLNGTPVARVSQNEIVDVRKGEPPQAGVAPISFDLRGAVMTEQLLQSMQDMANRARDEGAAKGAADGVKAAIDLNRRTCGQAFAPGM